MRRIRQTLPTLLWALAASLAAPAQSIERTVDERLRTYFNEYTTRLADIGTPKLDSVSIDNRQRTLKVYANATFGYQPFTPEVTERIYSDIKGMMPGPVNYYHTTVYTDGRPIEQLIPNALLDSDKRDKERLWNRTDRHTAPWVTRTSRPIEITRGLAGHHLAVWQSHGNYYRNDRDEWRWQRPRLFCTTEDLFTQSFVVPYIIPMLENAGAVVFTPRERDPQRHEVIVDNDRSAPGSVYYEEKSRKSPWKTSPLKGFAHHRESYTDREAPFVTGTARFAPTAGKKKKTHTLATWIPDIPETGSYAVYVSYQTLPGAVSDARYTVFHKGGATEFSVNQQMGGGTWVYLGTFEFDRGKNDYGFVALSNQSNDRGVVSADAVRFGGGMGNIERGGKLSGMPRYLEGARYWAQWAGMPYSVYGLREGENDYADDINTRSLMTNYLAGGSAYAPRLKGLKVPIEMTMGVHSDAGFTQSHTGLVGTLGIYTTQFNEGKLNAGLSRHTSRDLADLVLTGLHTDLSAFTGNPWNRRGMWNRNYSESRLPEVPSMILETLSHQNFADLKWGHDPNFKFTLGRSVYKSILRYVATQHQQPYTVQPLPVDHLALRFTQQPKPVKKRGKKQADATVRLSWRPVNDPLEPTAVPTSYIVYTRIGYGGFDNGTPVKGTSCDIAIKPGMVYSFKVTAVNAGGESFPSETLAAYQSPESNTTLLIVNGFDRLSGPATIETDTRQGFDLATDPGIAYHSHSTYCGMQTGFDRKQAGKETEGGLGYSGNELEGMHIAGNSFDYPFIHGKAVQHAGGYSFVSCSDEAVENGVTRLEDYPAVDLLLGLEKSGGKAATNGEAYQAFSPAMQQKITRYLQAGGNLLVSGSFVGSDAAATPTGETFISQVLKFTTDGHLPHPATAGSKGTLYTTGIQGSGLALTIPRTLNEATYAVTTPECLAPAQPAFAAMVYDEGNRCAAIAYPGETYRTFVLGFPLESIHSEEMRAQVMAMVINFLLKRV